MPDRSPPVFFLPLILSAAATGVCYWAAGPSLGLFFGGFFVVAFLTPAAVLASRSCLRGILATLAVILGVAIIWFLAVIQSRDSFEQWLALVAVLCGLSASLAGGGMLLVRLGLPRPLSASLTVIVALISLTWPIWLSPHLSQFSDRALNLLVENSPPLVANGVLINEPPWTEKTVAYQLTNLNQDVPIRLPASPMPCAAAYLLMGSVLLAASALAPRKRFAALASPA